MSALTTVQYVRSRTVEPSRIGRSIHQVALRPPSPLESGSTGDNFGDRRRAPNVASKGFVVRRAPRRGRYDRVAGHQRGSGSVAFAGSVLLVIVSDILPAAR